MNTLTKKTKVESDACVAAWRGLTEEIGRLPQPAEITDEEIQKEIDDHRAGR